MSHFPDIGTIVYEGPDSRNALAFRHYNAEEVVEGKTMREHLRFSVCYWHTFRATGADPFGSPTLERPWDDGSESVDYPDYALRVAEAVAGGQAARGVLLCGTGIGMSIAANKVAGVRAALVHDVDGARMSRLHNDANILVMGGRVLDEAAIREIVRVWLDTGFEGGRHARRVGKISDIEARGPRGED